MNLPQQYLLGYIWSVPNQTKLEYFGNILQKILNNQVKIQKHSTFGKIPTKIENRNENN